MAAFARVRRKRNATRGVHLEVMDQLFVLHGRIPVSWGLMGLVRVLCHIVGVRASGMLSPVFYAITGLVSPAPPRASGLRDKPDYHALRIRGRDVKSLDVIFIESWRGIFIECWRP